MRHALCALLVRSGAARHGEETQGPHGSGIYTEHLPRPLTRPRPTMASAAAATRRSMVFTVDPVETGIVDSLAHPGGNITGLTRLTRELGGKRLELLKEVVGRISRVGVLWDADEASVAIGFKEYEAAAHAMKIQLQSLEVRGPNPDLEGAFLAAAKARASALITIRNGLLNRYAKRIADLAVKNRLPSMYEGSDFVEAGGLISYSANDAEQFRRAASTWTEF